MTAFPARLIRIGRPTFFDAAQLLMSDPKPNPSMADIARRAGVAKSTVSMALRNDPTISEKQRVRIRKLATKMGYRTNALVARLMHELRSSKSHRYVATLALVDCSINGSKNMPKPSVVVDLLEGAETRARELGYGIDHFWLYEPGVTPARLAKIFRARNIQGMALYSSDEEVDALLPEYEPVWSQCPVVMMGKRSSKLPFHFVCNDHYSTAMQGTAGLLRLGYRRIGLYMVRWLDDALEHRFVAGHRECMDKAGLAGLRVFYLDLPRYNLQHTYKGGHPAFVQWISDHRLDAVLAVNSWAFEWLAKSGLRAPKDIGVALLDLPKESRGKVAGMEQRPEWLGMTTIDALIGQVLRHEVGVPPFQRGVMIESSWSEGGTAVAQTVAGNSRT